MGSEREIDSVAVGSGGARVGMIGCPGSLFFHGRTGQLAADLDRIRRWGAVGLVSLVEAHEFRMLAISDMQANVSAAEMWWRHLPIRDMQVPDDTFARRWSQERDFLHGELSAGRPFVVHCLAGLGRTGTVVARLLVESGLDVELAIAEVRANRPGAIQTTQQESWLRRPPESER